MCKYHLQICGMYTSDLVTDSTILGFVNHYFSMLRLNNISTFGAADSKRTELFNDLMFQLNILAIRDKHSDLFSYSVNNGWGRYFNKLVDQIAKIHQSSLAKISDFICISRYENYNKTSIRTNIDYPLAIYIQNLIYLHIGVGSQDVITRINIRIVKELIIEMLYIENFIADKYDVHNVFLNLGKQYFVRTQFYKYIDVGMIISSLTSACKKNSPWVRSCDWEKSKKP